ncbi:MAG: hypothetical protein ACR2KJ_11890 [Jatrophihabitans sp.]
MDRSAGPRVAAPVQLWTGIALVVLAVLLWGGRGVLSAGQKHSWDSGATPPSTVSLTGGHTYTLSTSGGVVALVERQGSAQPAASCTATDSSGASEELAVVTQTDDPRVLHVIGRFTASRDEQVSIICQDAGPIFVDDADDAHADRAGTLTLLMTILFAAGVGLVLNGAHRYTEAYAAAVAEQGDVEEGDEPSGPSSDSWFEPDVNRD